MTIRLKTLPLLLALLLSMAGFQTAPALAQAVYVPSQTRDLKHTDGARLDTLVDDVRGHYQSRLSNWFRGGISGKKIAVLGDSTSDKTGSASSLYNTYLAFYQAGGEALHGVTILDYGSNGASLSAWIGGGGTTGKTLANLITAAPDLIVFSFGINDVRLGTTNQSQLTALLIQAVNTLRAALPNTDIILRMPNSLCNDAATLATYLSPATAQAAQDYTDILRGSYRSLANKWPNVVLWDTQAEVFGETIKTLANNPLMQDTLHPGGTAHGYSPVADGIAALAGYRAPFSSSQAAAARSVSYGADYTVYPRAVEDPAYYDLVASGAYNSQGTNFLRFHWPSGRATEIYPLDIVVMGDQAPWQIPSGTGIGTYDDGTEDGATQINYTPPVSISVGTVKVYRHKYAFDHNIELYAKKFAAYPYKFRGYSYGGVNYTRIQALPHELPAGSRSAMTTGDVLIVAGLGVFTGVDSISVFDANTLQIGKTGTDFGNSHYGAPCWIFGNHSYENGTTTRVMGNEPPGTQAN